RTTTAVKSGMVFASADSVKPVWVETSSAPSRANSSMPLCEMESAIRTFGVVIVRHCSSFAGQGEALTELRWNFMSSWVSASETIEILGHEQAICFDHSTCSE